MRRLLFLALLLSGCIHTREVPVYVEVDRLVHVPAPAPAPPLTQRPRLLVTALPDSAGPALLFRYTALSLLQCQAYAEELERHLDAYRSPTRISNENPDLKKPD